MFEYIGKEFSEDLLGMEKILVVVFYASYCPFCQKFSKILEKYYFKERICFAKADVSDDDSPYWSKYSIEVVPTIIVFKDKMIVDRCDGILGKGIDEKVLASLLENVRRLE
ncbi:MAG: thioredoxin family protein [Nitrososphaeria archaeon]|nr:thioredoxin family protein [Nitrososphaeria archaeon]